MSIVIVGIFNPCCKRVLWKAKMETECMYIQSENARIFLRKFVYAAKITYLPNYMPELVLDRS